MFKKLKDGRIVSDEGFSIKTVGRAGLIYEEEDVSINVDSEMSGNAKVGYVVSSSSIAQYYEEKDEIDDKNTTRILNNIKKAFRFLGYEIKVVENF